MTSVSTASKLFGSQKKQNLRAELLKFLTQAETIIVDKHEQLRLSWCCVMAGGHLLIEDLPGMGKTTMVKVIAKLMDLPWKRIQCTSDLLPADIVGGGMYDESVRSFVFHPGPIFTNLVMADELNRASPKSQSAFLQSMEESSVTVDGITHKLPQPFIVIATQNSLDSAGTNHLPESQLDRFMMSISLGLPAREGEKQLLMDSTRVQKLDDLSSVVAKEQVLKMSKDVRSVHISSNVADYIMDLATWIRARAMGFSPRTALALTSAAKAWAYSESRDFVIPSDIQHVAKSVLQHRLVSKSTSMSENVQSIIEQALRTVEANE